MIKAPRASIPSTSATQIPAFAPVERPEDGRGILVVDGVQAVELLVVVEVAIEAVDDEEVA